MSPVTVGPRAAKDEFMRALNLDPSNTHHEGCYRAMRDEAIRTYKRLESDRSCLVDEKRRDPSVMPPFFWHHITKERQRAAIIETWQHAPVGSIQRQLFDRGATTGEHEPNWVTHWLLYSVFRSRDVRNNRNRRGDNEKGSGSGRHEVSKVYDPARDQHRSRHH
ncbi:uncharacterized protein AB675_1937 [Cyphellophora attinorum]|uniref:Uncharacterized protein n=1 Tax=Cyphellophora attinorum TaxID=1664694 RepID=A0A0N1HU34_9EURO|nr:uncharacterized protein AB675_1937 [Phialophora attinorum]KPI42772.1 hypothetical protein AB675_1937 [Phialophora attinorum]